MLCAALLALAAPVCAQLPPAFSEQIPQLAAALSQILSDSRAFTAAAELQLPAAKGGPPVTVPFVLTMLDGRMRFDFQLAATNRTGLPPEMAAAVRDLGLDRFTVVMQQDKDALVSFPALKGYFTVPLPQAPAAREQAQLNVGRLERRAAGSEIVDGRVCDKFLVTLPGANAMQATVWQARELKDLPVKLAAKLPGGGEYGVRFGAVRLQRSDARLFDAPAGFTKHAGLDAVMQAAALRLLSAPK